MILLTCILIGIIFAASVYLMLGGELKEICMGIFLLSHGAHLTLIASSRSPIGSAEAPRLPPVLADGIPLAHYVDPLPQALILTAIVIGFAVQAFLLTLLVVTWRRGRSINIDELAVEEQRPGE